jgi:SAM-dependent methyltransferase
MYKMSASSVSNDTSMTTAAETAPTTSHTFYRTWYAQNSPAPSTANPVWRAYVRRLQALIETFRRTHATEPTALEIGSGGGQLQHLVGRYVGLDVAPSAARFTARPFVAASAFALPFADASFDLVWSIWTLEHVIDPQQMLSEMVRVTRPGGSIYLCAAWFVPDWTLRRDAVARQRFRGLPGRILAAARAPRRWLAWPFIWLTRVRWLWQRQMPHLRYGLLLPDYSATHIPDADACVQVEAAAVILWLRTHGATCISHPGWMHILAARHDEPLVFRVGERSH